MANVYISPTGSGDKSGSSWANSAAITSLDAMAKKAGAGGTVLLAADKGDYNLKSIINVTTGNVTIKGQNANGTDGEAHFVGTRAADWAFGKADGIELFRIQKGADNLKFENLQIDNFGTGFRVGGDVKNLTIQHVDVDNVQRFFDTLRTGTNQTATVTGLTIKDVDVAGFSKGVVRLQYDTNNVLLEDIKGDSERQEGDNFAMGVVMADTVHDIVLRRVTMDNATDDKGTGVYWNGDGFAAESGAYNLTFIDTVARGNTDGGYDLKASHVVMKNVVSENNGENFRLWGKDVVIENATGLNPHYRGGSGTQGQVWIADSGEVTIKNSKFSDAGSKTKVFFVDSGGKLTLADNAITYAGTLLSGKTVTPITAVASKKVAATGLNSQGTAYSDGTKASVYTPQTTTVIQNPSEADSAADLASTVTGAFKKIVSGTGNDVMVGTSKSEMFIFDQGKATGADTIKLFGPNDFIVFGQKLGDADGDGLTGAGKDGIFQLSNGGTLVVEGLTKDLRLLGQTDEGFVYGDSGVWKAGSVVPTVKDDAVYVSTKANETYIASNARETFVFDTSAGGTGKDTIRGFGATDVLVTKKALADGNGDGLIAPGKNGVDLGDKVSVVSLPELSKAGLRFLGSDNDGFVYADAAVRPKGALEGKLNVADVLTGGKADTATDKFFFDTALDRQIGTDKIVNFGAKDVVISTTLLGSETVGSKLTASGGEFDLHVGADDLGGFTVTGIGGAAVTSLEYDGVKTVAGVDYYVYSTVGSAVGLETVG